MGPLVGAPDSGPLVGEGGRTPRPLEAGSGLLVPNDGGAMSLVGDMGFCISTEAESYQTKQHSRNRGELVTNKTTTKGLVTYRKTG